MIYEILNAFGISQLYENITTFPDLLKAFVFSIFGVLILSYFIKLISSLIPGTRNTYWRL